MKVLISGYIGNSITGVGRYLYELLRHILEIRPSWSFILLTNKDMDYFDQLGKRYKNLEIKKYLVSKNLPILNLLWHLCVFPFYGVFSKADVAFIPNVTFLMIKFIPTFVTIHDLIEFRIPNRFDKFRMLYRKIAVPITSKRADKIIAVSNSTLIDIINILKIPSGKIKLIYNGKNQKLLSYKFSKEYEERKLEELGIKHPYFLYVGTLDHPGKNVISIVKIFELVMLQCFPQKYQLVLCGKDGVNSQAIKEYIKKSKWKEYILCVGYQPDDVVSILYKNSKIFIYLSLYEGFGFPALEAMSFGKPVICSDIPSLREVVGKAGFLIKTHDLEEGSKIVINLLTDLELYKKISDKALNYSNMFDWRVSAKETAEYFEEILKGL